jgi:tetratricopeptide (TPR) repeat protein
MLQKSNLYLLLLYHFVWIIRVYSSHPVTVLELAIPQPPISIFRRDEESIVSKCRHFVRQAVESNYHVTHLMKLAVCLHQVQLTHEAMDLYQYIHNEHPDYSFVLANMALLSLTSGEPHQAKKLLDLYFQQVGGLYGDKLSPIQDRDARIYGPACTPTAMYKSDCVYALNLYASTHMQLANNSFAQTLYRRALELADENDTSLSSIYANLGDLLGNLGDDQGAADSFIKAFWKSFQGEKINPVSIINCHYEACFLPTFFESIFLFTLLLHISIFFPPFSFPRVS